MERTTSISELVSVLSDTPADSHLEVFRRCQAADSLGAAGPAATSALSALVRALDVRVEVDCVQALRVAAARAVWRIGRRAELALPHLIRALEDDYWRVVRTAVETLAEMGPAGRPAAPEVIALVKKRLASGPF